MAFDLEKYLCFGFYLLPAVGGEMQSLREKGEIEENAIGIVFWSAERGSATSDIAASFPDRKTRGLLARTKASSELMDTWGRELALTRTVSNI